jgi:peptidoglycan hydrolase CwlO-like protein
MIPIGRVLGLLTLLGLLTTRGPTPALAQVAPAGATERERFLSLLLLRQDQATERVLVQQKAQLQRQIDRLQNLIPRSPQQAQRNNLLEQRIVQRLHVLEQKIASPPPAALRRQLIQQEQALRRQIAQIEARLNRMEQLAANNPRLARQLERSMAQLRGQLQRASAQESSLERLAATPVSPLNVASMFGGGL